MFKALVFGLLSTESGEDEDLPGLKVMVRELDDVLFRDVGNKIRDSGKYVFVPNNTVKNCVRVWVLDVTSVLQANTYWDHSCTDILEILTGHSLMTPPHERFIYKRIRAALVCFQLV